MAQALAGKTALVTGGTSGIGLAVVRRFVDEGAHVVVTGRRQSALDAVAAELGDRVTAVRADASDPADVAALFAAVAARGAGLDAVHANAGVGALGALTELTAEDVDTTFAHQRARDGADRPGRAAVPERGRGDRRDRVDLRVRAPSAASASTARRRRRSRR